MGRPRRGRTLVSKARVILPTFSLGSAVEVHPIRGFSHLAWVSNSMRHIEFPFANTVFPMPCCEAERAGV